MSASARPQPAPRARKSGRRQTIAATAAALLCAWTIYADPVARARALIVAEPLLGALTPGEPPVKFGPVSARRAVIDGQTILYVEGTLRNEAGRALKTPGLKVALIGDDGRPLYTWSAKPSAALLPAAGEADFRTRLLSPPERFASIAVSLTEAR